MPPNAPQSLAPRSRLAWPLRAAAALLLLATLISSTTAPVAANPWDDAVQAAKEVVEVAKDRVQQLTQRKEQKEAELEQLRREGESAEDALQRVEGELYAAIEHRKAIRTQLEKTEVRIRDLEARQEEVRARLARRSAVYGQRLHLIYKLTQQPPLVLILGATGIHDFLKRLDAFAVLAREDSRQVAAWRREQEQSDQARRELDDQQAVQTRLKLEATENERLQARKRDQQQQLVAQIKAQESSTEQELTEMDQEAERLTEQIRHQIEVEIPRLEEIQRREEERRRREAAGQGQGQVPLSTGPFIWPVSGPITAVYGQRTFAQRFHTGLDIAANMRTPIRAAATGQVLHAGYAVQGNRRASYGMYVTLLHGNGRVTLYAHLDDRVSPPQVQKGQIIDRGTILGVIGMTGITSGPHLHFEVRERDGRTRNPQEFLP